MRAKWIAGHTVAFSFVVLLLSGCSSKPGSGAAAGTGPAAKAAFLDQKKVVPPRLEWTREVTSRKGGTINFKISAPGPFSVTLVTDKGMKAMQNKQKVDRADVLLTVDVKQPSIEQSVTLPAGSSHFILENQSDKVAEFHLQCFEP